MCRKTVPKVSSDSSECSVSKTWTSSSNNTLEIVWWLQTCPYLCSYNCLCIDGGSTSGSSKQRRDMRRPNAASIQTVDVVPDVGRSRVLLTYCMLHLFLCAAVWWSCSVYLIYLNELINEWMKWTGIMSEMTRYCAVTVQIQRKESVTR